MTRTAVALSAFVADSSLADPAGTTIDSTLVTAGVNVAVASSAVPAPRSAYRGILIRVAATVGTGKNLIVRKGANPPAFRRDLGDLTIALTDSTTTWAGPFDMSRFAQTDDSINIDFSTGTTGTITVFSVPSKFAGAD